MVAVIAVAATVAVAFPAAAAAPRVLRVGSFGGVRGDYSSIQAAVNAAAPGDWVLVAPGDYREHGAADAGVVISKPDVKLRGMDRNNTLVDGTGGGPPCSAAGSDQDAGAAGSDGKPAGRDGVVVTKGNAGVSVENLTACNFLTGSGGGGNQIWFNGGDGSGMTDLGAFHGAYLTATSTYWKDGDPHYGDYGLFASNVNGPGDFTHTYASNMADSDYYVGACPDCNTVIDDAHAQNSALGYSGTNSGGHLLIQNSEWDSNEVAIVPNSLNNDDAPSPQDGACPAGGSGPTGSHSCTIIRGNYVHDNNNPNAPGIGVSASGPVGTGILISGGRNDVITGNRVVHNGAWGILLVDYPDTESPPPISHCEGGTGSGSTCLYPAQGNEVFANTLSGNGFFGNPTNGDLADATNTHNPGNCWHDNVRPPGEGSVSSDPPSLQTTHASCGTPNSGDFTGPLGAEVACDSGGLGSCPDVPGSTYPRRTGTTIMAVSPQATMKEPCAGVPDNPWCKGGVSIGGAGTGRSRFRARLTLKVTPRRDRHAPYRFTARGRLILPAFTARAVGCRGRIAISFRSGKKRIASRRIRLPHNCSFRARLTLRRKRVGAHRRMRVRARFGGNATVGAVSATARRVRVK